MTDPVEALAAARQNILEIRTYASEEQMSLALRRLEAAIRADVVPTDACEGCGSADCSDLWASQRKCCPDCSHGDTVEDRVVPTGDAGLDAAAREVCRLWFDLAGPENRSATYAALVDDPDDAFSEAMWTLRARLSSSDTGHDHHDECDCGLPPSSDTGGRG